MREILIIALFIAAAAGYRAPNYAAADNLPLKEKLTTEKQTIKPKESTVTTIGTTLPAEPLIITTTAAKLDTALSSNAQPNVTPTTMQPIEESQNTAQPMIEVPNKEEEQPQISLPIYIPEEESTKRRIVTYDQRQEGQYNIRADLENFMIVLIPPSAQEGLSLLDLLSKSSLQRRNSPNKSKRHRYASALNIQPGSPKYQQAVRAKQSLPNLNYLARNTNEHNLHNAYQNSKPVSIAESTRSHIPEFIEGRTPYHVDISASDDEQGRVHPADRPVDVIPPPYPLAFQQLIKPYHLESEPTVIQALPPTELATTSGNFLEQLLGGNSYRGSRAIRIDNDFLDSNKLPGTFTYRHNAPELPFYRAEHSFGADKQYPPLDVPRYNDFLSFASASNPRSWDHNSDETHKQHLDAGKALDRDIDNDDLFVPPSLLLQDALDLDLQAGSVGYIDAATKALLSDGIARCAPGRRRDSYGVCREIEGY